MEKNNTIAFNFLKASKYIYIATYLIIILGIASLIINKGFKLGIDFAGGQEIRLLFSKEAKVSYQSLENTLNHAGFEVNITEIQAQEGSSGKEFFIYYQSEKSPSKEILAQAINKDFGDKNWSTLSESFVGPKIGKQLQKIGFYATIITLISILIYIALRFQLSFGVAALVSLIHGIFLLLAFISFLHISFDIPVLAAILTVIGYSLNDTVVIFDRIRYESQLFNQETSYQDHQYLINLGITKSLTRTFLIIFSILVVLFIMYFLGSSSLKPMTMVLIIGVIIGAIATNFIAPPILLMWHKKK